MSDFQAQTVTECLSTWCGLTVGHAEPHTDIRVQRSASRTEAAAWVYGDEIGDCSSYDAMSGALAAADAHDAANGIHRVSLDDATVERAARAMNAQFTLQWEKLPEWVREDEIRIARAVLAAAVEAGR